MANAKTHPPIIVRKKVSHHGHQGGAWKVAYADFVTALMALFIVLWLVSASEKVKKAVADYFIDPQGKKHLSKGGDKVGSGTSIAFSSAELEKIKKRIEQSLANIPDFQKLKKQIEMTITREGLRIELLENPKGVFFEIGKPEPTAICVEILTRLAGVLGTLPNNVLIEGHTDSAPYHLSEEYSNWELSSDRANQARRLLQEHGVRQNQVKQVRGFADQHLRNSAQPLDPANRRISVIVQYADFDERKFSLEASSGAMGANISSAVARDASAQKAAQPTSKVSERKSNSK
jgi:chemotaxis protein MotB